MRNLIRIVTILFVALSSALAQDETPLQVTVQNRAGDLPFSSSIGSDVEHVDVSSLNLVVRIPIAHVKGRGLDLDLTFRWDGMFWIAATRFPPAPSPPYQIWNIAQRNYLVPNGIGWEPNQPRVTWVASRFACGVQPWATGGIFWGHYIYHDADGGSHTMAIRQGAGDCDNGSFLMDDTVGPRPDLTTGGFTGGQSTPDIWQSNGTQVAWHHPPGGAPPPGTIYNGSQTVYGTFTDSNGNTLQQYAGGVDTLGRTLVSQTNGSNQITYTIKDSNGTSQTYTVNYTNIGLHTAFNASGPYGPITEVSPTRNVVTSIVLPTGKSYSFQYETAGYGGLSRITLPSGGYIDYAWGTISAGEKTRRYVASRTVHTGTGSFSWTFSPQCSADCSDMTNTVADPLGQQSTYTSSAGKITQVQIYSSAVGGTPLRQYDIAYTTKDDPVDPINYNTDVAPSTITTTLENGLVSKKEIDYQTTTFLWSLCIENNPLGCVAAMNEDTGIVMQSSKTALTGNVKETREYDWGSGAPGALLRRTKFTYLQDSDSNYLTYHIIDKVTSKTVCTGTATCNGSGDQTELTQYQYDNYTATNPTDPLLSTSGAAQHDYTHYPYTFKYRGNATHVLRWRNTDGAFLKTTYQYDDLGNIRRITTPLGNNTSWTYTDSWSGSACPPPTGYTGQAYPTQMTNPLNQLITRTYYPCTGLLQARKDQNDINNARAGTTHTHDRMGRETAVSLPDGGQTTTCYSDDPAQTGCYNSSSSLLTVTKTTKITSTLNLVSKLLHDDLGRQWQTQLTSDPDGITYVDTTFDALGRKASVSNPYRSTSDSTYGTTSFQYDALNRTTRVTQADGSAVVTSYDGNTSTVTDEASKSRKSQTDGIGRLTAVWEDPGTSPHLNYETDYTYDVVGNVTAVTQQGGSTQAYWRSRSFIYNTLSQLTSATNPESGTITYNYDDDGRLWKKTSPQANQTGSATTTISYCYDSLNRMTGKAYTAQNCPLTSPPVSYFYDQTSYNGLTIANGVGRRTGMSDAAGAEAWNYDPMGRPLRDRRTTNSVTLNTDYTYNLDGSVATQVYPSGRTITYTPGAGGRPLEAKDVANSINYLTAATYAPQGALYRFSNGSSISGAMTYNSRLQPLQLYFTTGTISSQTLTQLTQTTCPTTAAAIMSRKYNFGAGAYDNGNVLSITNCRDANRSQNFDYDNLNRIADAYTTGPNWGEAFTIDAWGNLTNKGPYLGKTNYELLNAAPATTKNQLTGYGYDAAGNMTSNGGATYAYDAENRLATAGGVTYTYDGDGNRVKKSNGTLYWGAGPLAESDLSASATSWKEYVFFVGKRVSREDASNSSVHYFFSDHLASTGVTTNSTGGTLEEDVDYYPYGGIASGTSSDHYLFTGKERDSESQLDYLGARYYGSSLGRFITPDWSELAAAVPYADFQNPQSLNLYGYVKNNPTTVADLDGHSDLVYNGSSHTITLYSATGQKIGSWHANNRVTRAASLRKVPDGTYKFQDTGSPHHHSGNDKNGTPKDSAKGEYGPYGIFRLQPFKADGGVHEGVGVHSGRDGVPDKTPEHGQGPDHVTQGCVRTNDDAMKQITQTVKTDPLNTLTVQNNRPTQQQPAQPTQPPPGQQQNVAPQPPSPKP